MRSCEQEWACEGNSLCAINTYFCNIVLLSGQTGPCLLRARKQGGFAANRIVLNLLCRPAFANRCCNDLPHTKCNDYLEVLQRVNRRESLTAKSAASDHYCSSSSRHGFKVGADRFSIAAAPMGAETELQNL